jgi:ABC-type polar amino acid transport system ATPase subunit
MPTYDTNQVLGFTGQCQCDALSDERCSVCKNRHHMIGQAYFEYQKDGPILEVADVTQKYGNLTVLENVHVKIRRLITNGKELGRIIAFLGPSGCGKTTLLRILAGLETPTAGEVYVKSIKAEHVLVRPGVVGLVMQQYPLYNHRTILGNLTVASAQFSKVDPKKRAMEMLVKFGLESKADAFPMQLSGGQRQRIAVAQQLLCSDHYLLMDEPTAGLDPISKKNVASLIQETAASGVTIILVTHDIPTACALADTVWLMGRKRDETGKIVSGAFIVDTYDLIEPGLAWNPNVRKHPAYAPLVQELTDRFDVL